MHLTLFLYLSRNYLNAIWITLGAISSIFLIANFIDLLKKTATKATENVSFFKITQLVFSKLPYLIHESFPYVMFIASIIVFQKLSRRNEYTALKASGISLWQFIIPFIITGFILGTLLVTVFNPISSNLLNFYRKEHSRIIGQNSMSFSLFNDGIWFVDKNINSNYKRLVNAKFLNLNKMEFKDITFLTLNNSYNLTRRVHAEIARLEDGEWALNNVKIYNEGEVFKTAESFLIKTKLQDTDVKNSLAEPEVVSLWEMPYLISNLNNAGYSSLRHISYMYKILSKPLFIIGFILISASFSLKSGRGVKTSKIILYGSLLGFATFFLGELTTFLGSNGKIAPLTAVLLASLTMISIGVSSIYHSDEV